MSCDERPRVVEGAPSARQVGAGALKDVVKQMAKSITIPDVEGRERRKFTRALNEFYNYNYNYIDSNRNLISDYGDRRRHGEAIASSVAESTVNQVISHRFVKKQQMRWQPENAHLLLQLRTATLNHDLRATFERWHPGSIPSSAPAIA